MLLPSLYVTTVLPHRYCPADTAGTFSLQPLEGGVVPFVPAAYVIVVLLTVTLVPASPFSPYTPIITGLLFDDVPSVYATFS